MLRISQLPSSSGQDIASQYSTRMLLKARRKALQQHGSGLELSRSSHSQITLRAEQMLQQNLMSSLILQ